MSKRLREERERTEVIVVIFVVVVDDTIVRGHAVRAI